MEVGIGRSTNTADSFKAGSEAAKAALARMNGKKPDFALLFTTEQFDQRRVLDGVHSVIGEVPLSGCCAGGVITAEALSRESVLLIAVASDAMKFVPAIGKGLSKSERSCVEEIAKSFGTAPEKILPETKDAVVLVFPDAFTGNTVELVDALYQQMGAGYKFVGGGAGDNLKFFKTYQFMGKEVFSDAVACGLLLSKEKIGMGVAHGWIPVRENLVVTSSKGNVVKTLGGSPAYEAYTKLFKNVPPIKEFAAFVAAHPLGIVTRKGEYLIRDPLKANDDGSLTCVASVPENSIVRIMEGDKKTLIKAARKAAQDAKKGLGGAEAGIVFVFDCISRLLFLGEDAKKEIDAVRGVFGKDVPVAGFFTFGEIAQPTEGGIPQFHNKTIVVCALPK